MERAMTKEEGITCASSNHPIDGPSSDDMSLVKAANGIFVIAELAQNLVRMLTELGRRRSGARVMAFERQRLTHEREASQSRMLDRARDIHVLDLGVVEHLIER